MISLSIDGDTFHPGDSLNGRIDIAFVGDARLKNVKTIHVSLTARIHGSGNEEKLEASRELLHEGRPTSNALHFSLRIPDKGPVSWQGRHVKVDWEVSTLFTISDAANILKAQPFTVAPRPISG